MHAAPHRAFVRLTTVIPFPSIPMNSGLANEEALRTLTLWLAGLAILTAVGVYVVGKLRGTYRESDLEPSKLITNFRELHSQGQLSDEEYRNIKSKLATQMQEQLEKSKKKDVVDF